MEFNKETSLGYALTTTLNLIRKKFNKKIKQFDLSSEQFAVMKLVSESEQLTPTQISELLNRDKATITRIIKSLETKGLIVKVDINNRSFYIELTQSGKEKLQKATEIALEFHKKIVDEIGQKELQQVINTLKKIREIF
jgi:DNA-binding MarR family transcriptional regulator